ncbi:hypothetical protein HF086_006106 [Spodoptera exigua]|uniref:Carboxypeptidase B n=1 Tax=Spodoptera exigua TaxID=7107 RepID=A0A922MUC5_SPOEX|nr:hypothetical protein HF086_006106 [Spodoptera exigua]
MASLLIVFVAFGFISQIYCSSQYDNHTLIRLHPTSLEHQKSVTQFNDPLGEIEIMKESRGVNDTLDILVPPTRMNFVHEYANSNGLLLEEKQKNYGREWVAPAMALYLVHRLTTDPAALQKGGELDGVDWYILPLVNPDGYEYSRSSTSNRMWRKTRSKHSASRCYGVDGNRNYGYKWAVSGVSNDPCHKETYAGPKPFSEPETRMVRNIMMDNAKRMKLYVSLHSYGQYLVYPWGFTGDYLPKQWKKLDNMAKAVSDAVERAGGQPFKVLSAGKWYPAAGGSDDFAFGAAGVPYSYTMELTEGYEFTYPENLLKTILPQFYEGFKEFAGRIRAEFVINKTNDAAICGCKSLRFCYEEMLHTLLDRDEASCIEDAAIGASTVVLSKERPTTDNPEEQETKPTIIIEAGQQGGTESVGLALYVIEQLVACEENDQMLQNVNWVILPCTNPDGQEYSRYSQIPWKKNLRPSDDQLSYGVDITRNFDIKWGSCTKIESGFSPIYPGVAPESENETIFIKNIIQKHKKWAKMYVSLKRDGHSIHYPYGYKRDPFHPSSLLRRVAGDITMRVNQRTGGVHLFINSSLFVYEGKPHCGHSVDYAFENGIPLSYEMRVFLGSDNKILSKFQPLPRGYDNSLRNGYLSGIREMYNVLTNEKKYGKIT